MFTSWREAEESWNDLLDEAGDVELNGVEYQRSRLLIEVDPTNWRCGLLDYIDAMGVDSDDLEGEGTDPR